MGFITNLKKFEKQAKKINKDGFVKEVIFFNNIYEIEVFDLKLNATFWPFLQISDDGEILDAFCTCKTSEKEGFCSHIAAAYYKIFTFEEAIHVRFKKSFFYSIFRILSSYTGYDSSSLKKEAENDYSFSKNKKEIFFIKCKKPKLKKLLDIFKNKLFPIDENSLKYSTLSTEQLEDLKARKASSDLKYDLSYLSDIAAWMFLLKDEGKKYSIDFAVNKDDFSSQIKISFPDILFKFHINKDDLIKIIPTLNTIHSPLKLFGYEGKQVEKITYDRERKSFSIKTTKGLFKEDQAAIKGDKIGEYIYVENVGFYPLKIDELLSSTVIEKEKVSFFLSKYRNVFEKKLENENFSTKPKQAQYYLYFDSDENLHINAYLFEKDDFDKKSSYFFNSWSYIEGKGFFEIDLLFKNIETIIKKENVSDFVTKNKVWLYNYEGFQIHLGSFESYLVYEMTKNQELIFSTKLDFPKDFISFIDFEDWVYIKNIGFYSKKEKRESLPIRPNLVLKKEEIATFISNHRDELEQIDNFFTEKEPIKKIGLSIFLNKDNKITLKPEISLNKGFNLSRLHFFDNFVYLENAGFIELPQKFKLPSRYEKEKVISESQENFFITYEIDRLKSCTIDLDNRLKKPDDLSLKLKKIVKRRRKTKTFWLLDLYYESSFGSVNAIDVFLSVNQNKRFLFSKAGLLNLKKPRFNWLKNLKKSSVNKKEHLLRLNTLDLIRLFLFEDVKLIKGRSKEAEETKKLLDELKTYETDKFLDISLLKANLRPYQEIGVKWLWFLYSYNLSALLCDDMGLGKTHQSMALLAALKKDNNFKYLVVCPTSVMYHWEELLKKFLPSINVSVYHGVHRKFNKDFELLLTSYGIIRSEIDHLKKIKFEIAIFDEIQIAKNKNSLTNKALLKIKASMKLGLTGTPIENYLKELKAIFDLILPAYLPSEAGFKEFFINPIEKHKDVERQKMLKKIIKPFILRRKKKDVLLDLPEKIEEIAYSDLSPEQRALYNETISMTKKEVLKNLEDGKKPVSYIHIFSILTKLKQICNHPALFLKDPINYTKYKSYKFDQFIELLDEAMESSQKVVVFSQYLDMLKIIEIHLKKKSIGFASIKGSTKKRHLQIKKFKEDENCRVFVASLLAAGVGIDLSAGSVVIHYDRWWNPAKENQATDRVHRIGQNRGVQVFKMVTKNTIEERIHEIIERKKYLIEEMIGKDEIDQVKTLSRDELIKVFKQIENT